MRIPRFKIAPVRTQAGVDAAVSLFREYAESLEVDLAYQDFEGEIAAMPGRYAPPAGELLLALDFRDNPIGCVGLRPLDAPDCCEMKRLYVCPEGRGTGAGKALVDALLQAAVRAGYREMRLDTLPSMRQAQELYRKLGFEVIEPYYDTPIIGTVFMRRRLTQPTREASCGGGTGVARSHAQRPG